MICNFSEIWNVLTRPHAWTFYVGISTKNVLYTHTNPSGCSKRWVQRERKREIERKTYTRNTHKYIDIMEATDVARKYRVYHTFFLSFNFLSISFSLSQQNYKGLQARMHVSVCVLIFIRRFHSVRFFVILVSLVLVTHTKRPTSIHIIIKAEKIDVKFFILNK